MDSVKSRKTVTFKNNEPDDNKSDADHDVNKHEIPRKLKEILEWDRNVTEHSIALARHKLPGFVSKSELKFFEVSDIL